MESTSEGCENDCQDDCNEKPLLQICKCIRIAEHASQFVLRLLEALRGLKHDPELVSSSTIEEIVKYFEENYRDVGDLRSQVRTGLRLACCQGLAMELFDNEFYFVGPTAKSMNESTCEESTKCLACSSSKTLQDCTLANCEKRNDTTAKNSCKANARKSNKKNWSKSSSECSKCNEKTYCKNVDRSATIPHSLDAGNTVTSNAVDESHKQSANRPNNPGKRKRENNSSSSKRRCSALDEHRTTVTKNNDEDTSSENTDEIYRQVQHQERRKQSKTREGEVKAWIKRCRKECRKRKD